MAAKKATVGRKPIDQSKPVDVRTKESAILRTNKAIGAISAIGKLKGLNEAQVNKIIGALEVATSTAKSQMLSQVPSQSKFSL